MGKTRHTYEYVYNFYKENNCELLETNFVNSTTKMKYRCKCGNISEITFGNFKQGKRCFQCSGTKKYSYDDVIHCSKKLKCILITDKYINCKSKLELKCQFDHIFYSTFDNLKQCERQNLEPCTICNKDNFKKYETKFIKNIIENEKYKILNDILKFKKIKVEDNFKVECPKGHTFETNFLNFYKLKYRCKKCYHEKRKIYDKTFIENILKENEYKIIELNMSDVTKIKCICPNKHLCIVNFYNFKNHNRRCRQCYLKRNRGKTHTNWNPDRTIKKRTSYLSFDLRKRFILKDDPLYQDYILNKEKYNIDHIFPRKAFIDNDLDKKYDPSIIKNICNSRDNLQILLKEDNLTKSAKYDQQQFLNWFNNKLTKYNSQVLKAS